MLRKMFVAMALIGMTSVTSAAPLCASVETGYACCKKCKSGKPCGDSCIGKDKACDKPKGCACKG